MMNKPVRVIEVSIVIELLEESQELLELLTSEISIQFPKKQVAEQGLKKMRGMISQLRESLQENNPIDARSQDSEA